jgi:hypothetical protein
MAILEECIELMIDQITETKSGGRDKEEEIYEFESLLPVAGKVFNSETALKTLRRMLICHKRPGLYHLNDYHYLLLYDTLLNFCEIHNDMVKEASGKDEKKKVSKVGAFYIEKIDFDYLIDIYFYDTDFLFDADTVMELGLEKRKDLGIDDEIFSISQGLAPHPEELKIKVHKSEKPVLRIHSRFWSPSSGVYPDLGLIE